MEHHRARRAIGMVALLGSLALGACAATPAQMELEQQQVALATSPPAPSAIVAAPTEQTAPPTERPAPPTIPPASPTSPPPSLNPNATPTPRPADEPPRVGLQAGHWLSEELPDELSRLRNNSGAYAAGYSEATVNLSIAERVAELLRAQGVVVDVLPATVPPGYDADAFVSIHADGSSSSSARGFKLATSWRTSRASQHLLEALTAEYGAATGQPLDHNITFNMRGYYAFSYRRHEHAIARTTPAVIVEMGFLTNPSDRALMVESPDTPAWGIAEGILRYLRERDPGDGAALLPPEFATQKPALEAGIDIYARPSADSQVLFHAEPTHRFMPIQELDGWYQVLVRGGSRVIGWVPKSSVIGTNDPFPTPAVSS